MALVDSEGWAWLPRDLLDLILKCIAGNCLDIIQFASVCKPWRSIANSHRHCELQLHQSMLMTPTNDNCDNKRSLHSICEERVYQIPLPMPCATRFFGSSKGWLFTADESMTITLINPFLNKEGKVVLPKFQLASDDTDEYLASQLEYGLDIDQYFFRKAILLSHGTSQLNQKRENYGVLLIYSCKERLAYLKPGAEAWETIKLDANDRTKFFTDIICYKGEAYAVSVFSALVGVDVTTGRCEIVVKASRSACITYLVESKDGDLLLVRRYLNLHMHMTKSFKVYKLSSDHGHGKPRWVQIKSFGEQALFLGDNYSLSVSTRDCPYCMPNCIYYVDDFYGHCGYIPRGFDDDSGIYNMEDGNFTRHYTPAPLRSPLTPFNLDCP